MSNEEIEYLNGISTKKIIDDLESKLNSLLKDYLIDDKCNQVKFDEQVAKVISKKLDEAYEEIRTNLLARTTNNPPDSEIKELLDQIRKRDIREKAKKIQYCMEKFNLTNISTKYPLKGYGWCYLHQYKYQKDIPLIYFWYAQYEKDNELYNVVEYKFYNGGNSSIFYEILFKATRNLNYNNLLVISKIEKTLLHEFTKQEDRQTEDATVGGFEIFNYEQPVEQKSLKDDECLND